MKNHTNFMLLMVCISLIYTSGYAIEMNNCKICLQCTQCTEDIMKDQFVDTLYQIVQNNFSNKFITQLVNINRLYVSKEVV